MKTPDMKQISSFCIILFTLLASVFTACDNDAHDGEYPLPEGQGALMVGLQSAAEVNSLTLYLFGGDGTVALRKDYADPRALASEYIPVNAGTYTVVVVANVTATDLPKQTTPADLTEWLKENASAYLSMLTASSQEEVTAGEVKRILLTLQGGTSGITLSTVRLLLTVPGKEMPPYTQTRATDGATHQLRCVAEVYRQGTTTRVHRRVQLCEEQTDGTYLAELSLLPGDYDVRLWADWVTDGTTNDKYYNADDLSAVTVLTDNYVANGLTDEKDAYYTNILSLTVTDEANQSSPSGELWGASSSDGVEGAGVRAVAVSLIRPFARYRIIADDVENYMDLLESGDDLPSIEDLTVRVSYEGFFPTGFSVADGRPNDALNGISYAADIVEADGYNPDEARQVGADFVLTNGEESFVTVTVQMIDRTTGETVSTVSGIKIPYRRGQLTTVSGAFLTAGRTSGGVDIDTDWDDDIVIEF